MSAYSNFSPALNKALNHALAYLESLDTDSVCATASLDELRGRLNRSLDEHGVPSEQVIDELVGDVEGGLLGSAGGRFFAWVMGGSLPASLAADWLVSTWDQNAAIYASSPAEAVIEEIVGNWLKELLRLPQSASFALTTGCQMAHLTCLSAARNSVLARHGWDVEAQGLVQGPPIRVLSGQRHASIDRTLRFLGLGSGCITDIPSMDEDGSLGPESLEAVLRAFSGQPIILLLSAGDINTGAYHNFRDLIPIAHAFGAWVHVDGAFGLWANASEKLRHLLDGVEEADSWATDGHKWLNVPYDCGYAFVADPRPHQAAMSVRASYIARSEVARDPFDWNLEWSRRGRGVATYAALRELGRKGISDLVERCSRHAHSLVTRIGALKGAEIMRESEINQGLVRFRSPDPGATETDHDAFTDRVIDEVVRTGRAFFGGTTWNGKRCMRISVCNWKTNDADVDVALGAVEEALGSLAGVSETMGESMR
jgi:glutamate/tyrosine decarboxylase-like PLP-dependent enzyme